jgi:methylated-DNA-[protein]-cysteine S-methyltransferase
VSGPDGLHRIWFDNGPVDLAAIVGDARERRDREVASQLDGWFSGTRREFSLTIAWPSELSPFSRTVLETLVERVPWGETVSYGELAELSGRPRAARAVGTIMAGNRVPFVIPCHRVIASGGRIGGYGGGRAAIDLKRWLLAREGVHFVSRSPAPRERAIRSKP